MSLYSIFHLYDCSFITYGGKNLHFKRNLVLILTILVVIILVSLYMPTALSILYEKEVSKKSCLLELRNLIYLLAKLYEVHF